MKILILLLVVEKIIQHTVVTLAFWYNWADIRSTVVVNPDVLMVLGGILTILFIISLWGLLTDHRWSLSLLTGLAIFDILGEFIAQGTIGIVITVSFVVAIALMILVLLYQRQLSRRTDVKNDSIAVS